MSDQTELKRSGSFFFPPDDPIYKEHFPGFPVVPGSLIIHSFLKEIRGENGRPAMMKQPEVSRFRFLRFTPPGECSFEISRKGERLECRLFSESQKLAEGRIKEKS